MKIAGLGAITALALAAPVLAVLALLGVAGTALACVTTSTALLASTAPVPAPARLWIADVQAACPTLPQPWIAAVMHADSDFDPTHHDPARGRGVITISDTDWLTTTGATWDADRDRNGTPDAYDPLTAATAAGRVLCGQLDALTAQTSAPSAGTAPLSPLDRLAAAHYDRVAVAGANVGLDAPTAYVAQVHEDTVAWTAPAAGPSPTGGTVVNPGCAGSLGRVGSILVPPGTPTDVAHAIATSLALVGTRSGWNNKCDRLACRAYGYANSGYDSASTHWLAMLATGHAHPGDRCPPAGAFAFWATGGPDGHVALVVASDPQCDPDRIQLVTNDALNSTTGFTGGVYLVTLTQLESGFMHPSGYRGWSDPVCAGTMTAVLTPGTS